jgi:plastocyanin
MKHRLLAPLVILLLLVLLAETACRGTSKSSPATEPESQATGTIRGQVRLLGTPPGRTVLRMNADPMCARANAGRGVADDEVVVSADGGLSNVVVQVEGDFPSSPAPSEPVVVDQLACVYAPRVVGVQVGQILRIGNSDPGLHNVHGVSPGRDGFNIGQPMAGIVNDVRLKEAGILRLQCDVHTWMVAHVLVVPHPYFSVSTPSGSFEIRNVPSGVHTVRAWHERYGPLTASVTVDADATARVDFNYPAEAKPSGR